MGPFDKFLREHPITRLVHFTPSSNLPHILRDGVLRPVEELAKDPTAAYRVTDMARLDGHREMTCCSIEYPNAFYYRTVAERAQATVYPDVAMLLLDPRWLMREGVLFYERNASSASVVARTGIEGLDSLYRQSMAGARGLTFSRGPLHDPACPTDMQAEVQIPGQIPLSSVRGIVAPSLALARQEFGRLERVGSHPETLQWIESADLFDPYAVEAAVRRGRPTTERQISTTELEA